MPLLGINKKYTFILSGNSDAFSHQITELIVQRYILVNMTPTTITVENL